jgi:hypothetical protein
VKFRNVEMKFTGIAAAVLIAMPGVASAQTPPAAIQAPTPLQIQARREVAAVESVLENAVRIGAEMLTRHVQSAAMPDMVMLTGMARARGFRLDGYGVLFDVEFPSIRRSVAWTMRALQRPDKELLNAMREMRKSMQSPDDAPARQELDRDINELEAEIRAYDQRVAAAAAGAAGGTVGAMTTAAKSPASDTAKMTPGSVADPRTDPKAIYLNEISNALVDAILDRGAVVGVGADEWLTVAARESADRGYLSMDPADTAMTFMLRIKGSDLKALQEHRLSKEDARKKVEVKQY